MEPGDILKDRYKIIEQAGSGRTSIIYRAQDEQSGDTVAVKSLRREYLTANQDGVMRFMREGAVLKQTDHPHLVKVRETVDSADGSYIVMEYLGGGTLKSKLITSEDGLPIKDALSTITKIADALMYLHNNKIIHRDVTPMNIMFTDSGVPKLMDLSVARMGHMSPLTLKSALLGTVVYMSPELILGESSANAKSDIWALGITLYETVAGQLPFDLKRTNDVMSIVKIPAPTLRTFRPDAPADLELLLQKMLTIDTEKRIGEMEQVITALRTLQAAL